MTGGDVSTTLRDEGLDGLGVLDTQETLRLEAQRLLPLARVGVRAEYVDDDSLTFLDLVAFPLKVLTGEGRQHRHEGAETAYFLSEGNGVLVVHEGSRGRMEFCSSIPASLASRSLPSVPR